MEILIFYAIQFILYFQYPLLAIIMTTVSLLTIRVRKCMDGKYEVIWGIIPMIEWYKERRKL